MRQIDEQHIEAVHHRRRRAAHRAVEAEDRNVVHRIEVIRRLDHVVLLVAPQPVLRAERRGEAQAGEGRERIERMPQVAGDGGGVRQQRHTASGERLAQRGLLDQPVDAELHVRRNSTTKLSG
jgi:hypothetical protein